MKQNDERTFDFQVRFNWCSNFCVIENKDNLREDFCDLISLLIREFVNQIVSIKKAVKQKEMFGNDLFFLIVTYWIDFAVKNDFNMIEKIERSRKLELSANKFSYSDGTNELNCKIILDNIEDFRFCFYSLLDYYYKNNVVEQNKIRELKRELEKQNDFEDDRMFFLKYTEGTLVENLMLMLNNKEYWEGILKENILSKSEFVS